MCDCDSDFDLVDYDHDSVMVIVEGKSVDAYELLFGIEVILQDFFDVRVSGGYVDDEFAYIEFYDSYDATKLIRATREYSKKVNSPSHVEYTFNDFVEDGIFSWKIELRAIQVVNGRSVDAHVLVLVVPIEHLLDAHDELLMV